MNPFEKDPIIGCGYNMLMELMSVTTTSGKKFKLMKDDND